MSYAQEHGVHRLTPISWAFGLQLAMRAMSRFLPVTSRPRMGPGSRSSMVHRSEAPHGQSIDRRSPNTWNFCSFGRGHRMITNLDTYQRLGDGEGPPGPTDFPDLGCPPLLRTAGAWGGGLRGSCGGAAPSLAPPPLFPPPPWLGGGGGVWCGGVVGGGGVGVWGWVWVVVGWWGCGGISTTTTAVLTFRGRPQLSRVHRTRLIRFFVRYRRSGESHRFVARGPVVTTGSERRRRRDVSGPPPPPPPLGGPIKCRFLCKTLAWVATWGFGLVCCGLVSGFWVLCPVGRLWGARSAADLGSSFTAGA